MDINQSNQPAVGTLIQVSNDYTFAGNIVERQFFALIAEWETDDQLAARIAAQPDTCPDRRQFPIIITQMPSRANPDVMTMERYLFGRMPDDAAPVETAPVPSYDVDAVLQENGVTQAEALGLMTRLTNLITGTSPQSVFNTASAMMQDKDDLLTRIKAISEVIKQ